MSEEWFQQPFETPLSNYCWCGKCETVHKSVSWFRDDWFCPNCGASLWELVDWEEIRRAIPYYPESPKEGTRFPKHGWPVKPPRD